MDEIAREFIQVKVWAQKKPVVIGRRRDVEGLVRILNRLWRTTAPTGGL